VRPFRCPAGPARRLGRSGRRVPGRNHFRPARAGRARHGHLARSPGHGGRTLPHGPGAVVPPRVLTGYPGPVTTVHRPSSDATHQVLNQPTPLEGYNVFEQDAVLSEAVAREAPGWDPARLREFGAVVGGDPLRL